MRAGLLFGMSLAVYSLYQDHQFNPELKTGDQWLAVAWETEVTLGNILMIVLFVWPVIS